MSNLIATILPGIGEMANIHPIIVHFPIAMFTGFFTMELLGFILKKEQLRVAATWMLYLGAIGAIAAVAAGLRAEDTISHADAAHKLMERHELFGFVVLAIGMVLSLWRIIVKGRFSHTAQILHLVAAFILLVVMSLGADMGALMVYKHGVAVKAVPKPKGHEHNPAESHNEEEIISIIEEYEDIDAHEGEHDKGADLHEEPDEGSHNDEGEEPHGH